MFKGVLMRMKGWPKHLDLTHHPTYHPNSLEQSTILSPRRMGSPLQITPAKLYLESMHSSVLGRPTQWPVLARLPSVWVKPPFMHVRDYIIMPAEAWVQEGSNGRCSKWKVSEQDPKSFFACRAFQNPGLLSVGQIYALHKMLNFLKSLKTLKILSLTERGNKNEDRV